MPEPTAGDLRELDTCHPFIRHVMLWVYKRWPCKVLEGHRGEKRQNWLYDHRASRVRFPHGRHNSIPSMAVDVMPLPFGYPPELTPEQKAIMKQWARWYRFAGFIEGVAFILSHLWPSKKRILWTGGQDWDRDGDLSDQKFDDLAHHQIQEKP